MRKLAFVVVVAALAAAPTALGKELQSVSVCGPEGCNSSGDGGAGAGAGGGGAGGGGGGGAAFAALVRAFEGDTGSAGAPKTILDPVQAGEFYKLGVLVRGDHPPAGHFSVEMWYVKPNLIRFLRGGAYPEPFKRLGPAASALLARLASDLKPFPAPKVVGAYVNGKRAVNPAVYNGLFSGPETTEATLSDSSKWVNVSLMPDRANPWFAGDMQFLYMPTEQALFFDKPVKVGYDLAAAIARDGGLPAPPQPDARSWERPIAIGVLAFALVVAAAVFLIRRRPRDAERAQPTTA
jgi:hypothetical protein